jgi:thiamine biosynthesis protein ThiS
LQITLNGDAYEVAGPLTVSELLAHLNIDARRVAVERNLERGRRDRDRQLRRRRLYGMAEG